ncbi:MAG: hypothetical protein JOY54_17980 [Acidobacteriaceae bacterium]|nr:hypothetical protein [Acidobacteriaceae bacterium]
MVKAKNPGAGRGKGGGPKSESGKAKSSRNSIQHGVLAKNTIILPGESREEYDEIFFGWWNEYEPEGYAEERLVKLLISNDWFLKRAMRKLEEAEAAVLGRDAGPQDWSEAERAHLQCMQRYKTAAERAFYRSLNAVQGLRKDRIWMVDKIGKMRDESCDQRAKIRELEWKLAQAEQSAKPDQRAAVPFNPMLKNPFAEAEAKTAAQQLFQGQLHAKKQRKIPILNQWIEIEVRDGKTVTTYYPPNEELIKDGQAMAPPPELVYRRLCFVNGVPEEYAWTTNDPVVRESGGMGIQRMDVDTWLEVIEKEKAGGTGHVGPTGHGNLPRPMERGGCDCEVCSHNRAVLERRAG